MSTKATPYPIYDIYMDLKPYFDLFARIGWIGLGVGSG